eukprot:765960-Hanusia_phi.AAC.6
MVGTMLSTGTLGELAVSLELDLTCQFKVCRSSQLETFRAKAVLEEEKAREPGLGDACYSDAARLMLFAAEVQIPDHKGGVTGKVYISGEKASANELCRGTGGHIS